jgi:hypothetical protein
MVAPNRRKRVDGEVMIVAKYPKKAVKELRIFIRIAPYRMA